MQLPGHVPGSFRPKCPGRREAAGTTGVEAIAEGVGVVN